jgi:hypothetical protein
MKVIFVGAGPGDPGLLKVKARDLLSSAEICVYAGSLVSPDVLELIPPGAEKHNSAGMSLPDIVGVFHAQARESMIRLHSGDLSIYGAIRTDVGADRIDDYEVVPASAPSRLRRSPARRVYGPGNFPDDFFSPALRRTCPAGAGPRSWPNRRYPVFLSADRLEESAGRLIRLRKRLPGRVHITPPGRPKIAGSWGDRRPAGRD